MHYFSISQIYFGIELYMIQTGLLSETVFFVCPSWTSSQKNSS